MEKNVEKYDSDDSDDSKKDLIREFYRSLGFYFVKINVEISTLEKISHVHVAYTNNINQYVSLMCLETSKHEISQFFRIESLQMFNPSYSVARVSNTHYK